MILYLKFLTCVDSHFDYLLNIQFHFILFYFPLIQVFPLSHILIYSLTVILKGTISLRETLVEKVENRLKYPTSFYSF